MDPATMSLLAAGGSKLFSGLGSIIGGNAQARAARRAAAEANALMREGLEFQKGIYSDSKTNLNPFIEAGQRGAAGYENAITNFTQPTLDFQKKDFTLDNWKDPGYDYRIAEANKAIEGAAAAKGGALGSGALKSLQTRGQDMASQEYQNAFTRFDADQKRKLNESLGIYDRDFQFGTQNIKNYGDLSNLGLGAAGTLGGLGQGFGSQVGQTYSNMADNVGTGIMAGGQADANTWNNLFSGGSSLFQDLGGFLAADAKNPANVMRHSVIPQANKQRSLL